MNWKEIKAEYEATTITLKALAEKHGVKLGTLKSRKSRDGWSRDATEGKDATKVATIKPNATKAKIIDEPVFVEAEGLTDKQRLFCVYYVKSFNATQSAIKAGYASDSAHVEGSRLLRNAKVSDEIRRLKGEVMQGVFIDAMDVLNKYIQIAFADITDYATFGKKYVPAVNPVNGERMFDDEGNEIMNSYSYVDFIESTEVDGTIISEVKQGKDGISVKLADKMKALEKLEQYFDLLPESQRRKLQEEKMKAEIAKMQAETKNEKKGSGRLVIVNDKEEMRRVMDERSNDN